MAGGLGNQTTPLYVFKKASIVGGPTPLAEYTFDWLLSRTLWSKDDLQAIIDVLRDLDAPQVLLAGPPGTGKTWLARHITWHLTQKRPLSYRLVQFHPSYSYEEFIEGLRPVITDRGVDFKRVDGVVLDMAKQIENADDLHILIIDEMNRANLPRVFGELLFLFEYRDEPVSLRYSKNFELPKNLRFLGTANTADRSIRSIDSAMRRRFEVFECSPRAEIIDAYYLSDSAGAPHLNDVPTLIAGFENLNKDLETQLDRHHTVGHTFFMKRHMTRDRLRATWERQLKPLIEEYFFDLPDVAAGFQFDNYWP